MYLLGLRHFFNESTVKDEIINKCRDHVKSSEPMGTRKVKNIGTVSVDRVFHLGHSKSLQPPSRRSDADDRHDQSRQTQKLSNLYTGSMIQDYDMMFSGMDRKSQKRTGV